MSQKLAAVAFLFTLFLTNALAQQMPKP
ncbi:MAG: hypothetical protein RI948_1263, partial [Bacteroidota bacterium]